jgi:phenylalanyl-tRNA synthetase alpha subunit
MTYSEQLKQKETQLTNLKASALAKKSNIEQLIEKRKKLEDECKSKFGISLSEVAEKLEALKKEIESKSEQIGSEVDKIEQELANIKC